MISEVVHSSYSVGNGAKNSLGKLLSRILYSDIFIGRLASNRINTQYRSGSYVDYSRY